MISPGTIKLYYCRNERFGAYVDRYAKSRGIDVDTALTHAIVKEVYKYYKSEEA